jgi:hypothetical protein
MMAHVYSRERAAIGSAALFARTVQARSEVERTLALLNNDETESQKTLDEMARLRAGELNLARAPRSLTEAEKRAARLFPARNKGMELENLGYVIRILDKDSTAQIPKIQAALDETSQFFRAQGEGELRLMGFSDAPAFYVDGSRSILEIRDAMAAEYGPIPVEALELYFRAFEKSGVMRILER